MRARWPTLIALAGFGGWLAIALITWLVATPLGHDESQYAIAAQDALADHPPRWFYLSRGMNAVAIPGVLLGGSELAMRVLPLLLGVAFAGATYAVGRSAVGATAAGWAIAVLAAAKPIIRMSTDLLSDLPSGACLLAALVVILGEVDREQGPRWRIVLIAPLLAAAFYLRYGNVVAIAVIVGASVLVGARTLVRRPLPVIVTAVLFLVLLVPHFRQAEGLTGSPLGILLRSSEVPQDTHDGMGGLETYLTSNPFKYYGWPTPFALVAGVLAVIPALRARDRRRLLVWLVAAGTFLAMGLITHGILRYIIVPVALFVVLGTDVITRGLDCLPKKPRLALTAVAVGALAAIWLMLAHRQLTADDFRAHRMRGTLAAARVIREDAAGAPCAVLGYHYTQLEWYSGCTAPLVLAPESAAAALAQGKRVYLVRDHTPGWVEKWKPNFFEMPGTIHALLLLPYVEVARLDPR